jgi:hypothetical protein
LGAVSIDFIPSGITRALFFTLSGEDTPRIGHGARGFPGSGKARTVAGSVLEALPRFGNGEMGAGREREENAGHGAASL